MSKRRKDTILIGLTALQRRCACTVKGHKFEFEKNLGPTGGTLDPSVPDNILLRCKRCAKVIQMQDPHPKSLGVPVDVFESVANKKFAHS